MTCYTIERHKKKTWTTYIVYVHQGIAKHLTRYIRVKAHAISVSILSFTLACFLNFGEFPMNKNLKLDASSICLYFLRYVTIRSSLYLRCKYKKNFGTLQVNTKESCGFCEKEKSQVLRLIDTYR